MNSPPKFIPKAERERLKKEREAREKEQPGRPLHQPIVKPIAAPATSFVEAHIPAIRNSQKKRTVDRKPKFDWDEEDDTTAGTELPLSIVYHKGALSSLGKDSINSKDPYDHLDWRSKPLQHMKERDWRIMREEFSISTRGGKIPKPLRSWKEANISKNLLEILHNVGYHEPTPIQRQVIPIALQNRDLIGIAETGSGKTCAFLIPMLNYISLMPLLDEHKSQDGPYAIVLVPTRELAQQIEQEANKFARPFRYRTMSIVGGRSYEDQVLELRHGVEVIIATPGRLRDIIDRRILVLNQCSYVVLDECDRMLDLGFEEDVNYILSYLPPLAHKPDQIPDSDILKYRQMTMFSATMPPALEKVAKTYLNQPAVVYIGSIGQAVETVNQIVEFVPDDKKLARLLALLQNRYDPPVVVFVNMKKNVDLLAKSLEQNGYQVATLHGGKSQDAREAALQLIKSGRKHILVATDVASRGIDIPNVSLVVNYDMAGTIEVYTHRIGRTGRAGKSGTAVTFLTMDDSSLFFDLKQMLIKSKSKVPGALLKHEAAAQRPEAGQKRKFEE